MKMVSSSGPTLYRVNKISADTIQELHQEGIHNSLSLNQILAIATEIDQLATISKAQQRHFHNIQQRIYFQTCQKHMQRLNTQLNLRAKLKKLKSNHQKAHSIAEKVDRVIIRRHKNNHAKSHLRWVIRLKLLHLFSLQPLGLRLKRKAVVPSLEISSMYGCINHRVRKSSTRRYLCLKRHVLHNTNQG